MNKKELRKLLNDISADIQDMCEDNEVMRAEVEEYFDRIVILGEKK